VNCRHCHAPLSDVFIDLGTAPPSNAFLRAEDLSAPEVWFPLRAYTCSRCFLVQVDEIQRHDMLFCSDYVYFSSYSRSWLAHAESFVAQAVERLALDARSLVVEIASNDGYLLQYAKARGLRCVGIEPTAGTAAAARARGIETVERFLGAEVAKEFSAQYGRADLVVANNVLAHVPDINDFVAGIHTLLAAQGVASIEFPHLLQLVQQRQFDTIYHEHFSYLSLHTARQILASAGLRVFDVERLSTHGGSLRLWACHGQASHETTPKVATVLAEEETAGMLNMGFYRGFQAEADAIKDAFLRFLLEAKHTGKRVMGYGAAAKGNTLINYAGVRADLLACVADASPHKQGRYLPGSRIPVVTEAHLRRGRADYVVVLPWNLREEISNQLAYIRDWGGQFVTAVPQLALT